MIRKTVEDLGSRAVPGNTEGGQMIARVQEALRAYDALNPVDRALHDADQRRSFVRGQSGRDPGPDVLAEEVRRLRAEVWDAARAISEINREAIGYLDRAERAEAILQKLADEYNRDEECSAKRIGQLIEEGEETLRAAELHASSSAVPPSTDGRRENQDHHGDPA